MSETPDVGKQRGEQSVPASQLSSTGTSPRRERSESVELEYDERKHVSDGEFQQSSYAEHQVDPSEKVACITLDLENDWYFDEPGYDHLTFEYVEEYVELIRELDVPVTFFVVGRTLERFPEVVDTLDRSLDSEFHLHSYQHDTTKSYDFRTEIRRGKEAFVDHFGYEPQGYRAPQGNIEPDELPILEDEGFRFDSSVFPSYRPGVYNNLTEPLEPYRPENTSNFLEVPIAATPWTRIPICQSYLKLLGRPYLSSLKYVPLPNPLVFNTHLQDFFHTDSHDHLDQPKRTIMKRNLGRSPELFSEFIEVLRERGYFFVSMTELLPCPPDGDDDTTTDLDEQDYKRDRNDPATSDSTPKRTEST